MRNVILLKRILTPIVILFAAIGCFAQTPQAERPQGLYRLQRFIYQDGRTSSPGFYQYKYAADSVGLLIFYRAFNNTTQWNNLLVEIRENRPLLPTGEQPQGSDGHGTQIFNVDDRQFYFKWYNDRWPNMSRLGEFITEVYTKDDIQENVAKAFMLLENKPQSATSKFHGWWMRVAASANPDGSGQRRSVPVRWKAYGPDLSMVLDIQDNGKAMVCYLTNTVRYESDSLIHEIGHPCNIHWIDENCHALTFMQENGQKLTEVWARGGLPPMWQSVFRTHIPLYRDGAACMRDAVEAAKRDDLKQAELFISEAISEKEVNIQTLCAATLEIAVLLNDAQKYKESKDFCRRQLDKIKAYVSSGHDHQAASKAYAHMIEVAMSMATYRSGEEQAGKRMIEGCLTKVESEIEKYKTIQSMGDYVYILYLCNLTTYNQAYDIIGAERTLLYLDAVALMAPAMVEQNKMLVLQCRAKCYLLQGNKDDARKLWQQMKETDADYCKNLPDDHPLKQTFGE